MRATTGAAQCVLSQTGAYTTSALCSTGTQCGWKYKCNPDFSCTLGADGLYSTPADCFGDAGKCGWKYSCVNNVCTQAKDGTYATQTDCLGATGKCGWKYSCVNGTCTLAQDGTYATLADCSASQCGWKYKYVNGACTLAADGTYATLAECQSLQVTVPAGSGTILRSQAPGYYNAGQEYLFPIGSPFKALKQFIQVRCASTGTVRIPKTSSDGTVGSGSDNAEARYVVRGFGNVTANTPDPDSSYPVIVWGDEAWGGRNDTDVGSIPGFPANNSNGNGRATIDKTYQTYIRVWDNTDEDINLTWPQITITQSDNEGYTMTTVSGTPRGTYPHTITSSDKTPCLNYYYNKDNGYVSFDSELGVMYSPDGNYKLYMDRAVGKLKMYKKSTNQTVEVPLTTTTDTVALCMQTDGSLKAYSFQYDLKASAGSAGSGGPYTFSLNNAGRLSVKDKAGSERWYFLFPAQTETGYMYDM